MAYTEVMNISDEAIRNVRLNQLAELSNYVFTPKVLHYVNKLGEIADKASGKLYDAMYVDLENEKGLIEVDRSYLFTELASWGRRRVWTDDYKVGVAEVVKGWEMLDNKEFDDVLVDQIDKAKEAANNIANELSRAYLLEEIDKIDTGRQSMLNDNLSKAVEAELEKLPVDKTAADLFIDKSELEALLAGVTTKIEEAKTAGVTDEDIQALESYGRIAVLAIRIADIEVEEFREVNAAVLELNEDNVLLENKNDVEVALLAYDSLSDDAKLQLLEEKILLDNLLSIIASVGEVSAVDEFKTSNSRVLELTVDIVTIEDKNDVQAALSEYDSLSDLDKEELSLEKAILDNLSEVIYILEVFTEIDEFAKKLFLCFSANNRYGSNNG